jgi:hypothetical protein
MTASNTGAPDVRTAHEDLVTLGQIMRRVDKLSRTSQIWLHDAIGEHLGIIVVEAAIDETGPYREAAS